MEKTKLVILKKKAIFTLFILERKKKILALCWFGKGLCIYKIKK